MPGSRRSAPSCRPTTSRARPGRRGWIRPAFLLKAQCCVVAVSSALWACGRARDAAWSFSLGGIAAECLAIFMAAVGKTVEELDLQLEAVTKDVWVLRSIALTWLVGGAVLGILPLGSRSRRTVGITWLVLASWRYIIHSIRNSEPFSTWVLTVFMPSTLLPGVLGCLVATTGGRLAGRQ